MKHGNRILNKKLTFCMVLLFVLCFVSCQFEKSHENINETISEKTGKDVKIFDKNDTLMVSLRGSFDSTGHESIGNALNAITVAIISNNRNSFGQDVILVSIYQREDANAPLLSYQSDSSEISRVYYMQSYFPGFLDRLEYFVKHFTAKQLNTLDHVTNTLMEHENHNMQGQGFLNLFWNSHILCQLNYDSLEIEISKTILEIAADSKLCPECNKNAIDGFFTHCR